MSRKILIYGFAFASLICLSTFIYFENEMYNSFRNDMLIGRVAPIIILMIGILLMTLSLRKSSKHGLSVGRIGFSGMLFTTVVCIVWPVFYYAYTQKKPDTIPNIKEAILQRKIDFKKNNNEEITDEELEQSKADLDKAFTAKMQIRVTIIMYFSMGILTASGLALLLGRKTTEIAQELNASNSNKKENA